MEEYYENIFSSLIDGIVVVDAEFRISTFTVVAEQMTGLQSAAVLNRPISEIFPENPELHTLLQKSMRTGRSYSDSSFSLQGCLGKRRDVGLVTSPLIDLKGRSVGGVIVFRDLSRMRVLEERLRKSERLASLGILAAGMAHEIKNPLGGIRGATQLLRDELGEGNPLRENTDIVVREVDRLNRIVQELLEFSRPPQLELRALNVHQVLDRVISLTRMENANSRVSMVRNFDPSLPEVRGDPDQLTQVFLNLLRNGIEAMNHEGTLKLTTRMLPGYHVLGDGGEKIRMIAVDVEDSGGGISAEEVGRIFDPFYTGKAGGVGLGLALCHRIIEEHGGKIDVGNTTQGACFTVMLPIDTNDMHFPIRGNDV